MGTASNQAPDVTEIRAFLSIDDEGDFAYHQSEEAMLASFEYVSEAACIIDPAGTQYRLSLDSARRLRLSPGLGKVDGSWLKQAWFTALRTHSQEHRVRRLLPTDPDAMLAELLEVLALEQGIREPGASWRITAAGVTEMAPTMAEVDRRMSELRHHEGLRVQDPRGHIYRPEWLHQHLNPGKPFYVELPVTSRSNN
ncbi:hypothetical protein [Arthrobacter sp. fls2-241-R2A-200]|uniref:hypothetical protein n=1 Tax=unclassified Arthrobacter TaxID=235627 RepID=UPI00254C51FB|nr:hypothetical protein [Arthrobacter sp. fls2-241-R2A-200]